MRRALLCVPLFATLTACGAPQRTVHTATYPTGEPRWQTEMQEGVPHGTTVTWHANGQVASRGTYLAGRKDGSFQYWDQAGRLVRTEEFRDGALVSTTGSPDPAGEISAPSVTALAPAGPEPPPTPDDYTELRVGVGAGVSSAAKLEGEDEPDTVGGMSLMVLRRDQSRILGVTGQFSGELFGPSHSYLGGVVGYAGAGREAHLELLAEGGIHAITGIGDDLFARGMGDNAAMLPYVGLQARLVLDPGEPNDLVFEVGAAARTDVMSEQKQIVQESCFFGCTVETQRWRLGGSSVELVAGFSYQFD